MSCEIVSKFPANVNATIILGQQKRVGKLSRMFESMAAELAVVNDSPETLQEIAQAISEEDPKAAESINRLKSLTTRINNLKTASEIMGKLIDAESRVFSLDEESKGSPVDDGIKVTFVRPE